MLIASFGLLIRKIAISELVTTRTHSLDNFDLH